MDVSALNGAYGTYSPSNGSDVETEDKTSLSINDFFELLAAQLQNQDMLNPVDNTEFISQMAQFSTLSQIQELSKSFQMSYAVSLIGKNVTVASTNENGVTEYVSGTVDNVSLISGAPNVDIKGTAYPASDVTLVENA